MIACTAVATILPVLGNKLDRSITFGGNCFADILGALLFGWDLSYIHALLNCLSFLPNGLA